jgi:ferric iron reductase protein FhuF
VAASLFFQGYAARLLSPQLACMAVNGCVPDLPAARLAWRHPDDQMIELGLSPGAGWAADRRPLLEHLVAISFGEHLAPLAGALRLRVRMSPGLLQGNAASALVSGLRLLSGQLGAAGGHGASGGHGVPWRSLAAHALAQPDLRGSGTLRAGEPAFVRRSCCLYYRADGALCADCPLPRRPA